MHEGTVNEGWAFIRFVWNNHYLPNQEAVVLLLLGGGNKTNIHCSIRLSWSSSVNVCNAAPPLSQECVSASSCAVAAAAQGLQTAAMMGCILDTSTPPPFKKPCWLLGQVLLRYKIPTDMVRFSVIVCAGLAFVFHLPFLGFFYFIKNVWYFGGKEAYHITAPPWVDPGWGPFVACQPHPFRCISCLYLCYQNKAKCQKQSWQNSH